MTDHTNSLCDHTAGFNARSRPTTRNGCKGGGLQLSASDMRLGQPRHDSMDEAPTEAPPTRTSVKGMVPRSGLASMRDGATLNDLDAALLRIVSDPGRLGSFYEIMGGYCHKARNHLNSISLSLYLARKAPPCEDSPCWAEVAERYRAVEALFDRLQNVCRPMPLSRLRVPLGALLGEKRPGWAEQLAGRGIALEIAGPEHPVPVNVDMMRLTHALDALIGERARGARPGTTLRLDWRAEPRRVILEFTESPPERPAAAAPGDEGPLSLAIPLLARVAAEHGGGLDAGRFDPLRLRLHIPAAAADANPHRAGDPADADQARAAGPPLTGPAARP